MSRAYMPFVSRVLLAAFPFVLVAGCPVNPDALNLPASLAGNYWVEYADGTLTTFELPPQRGEDGTWRAVETAQPDWYTGPALYEVHDDGVWERVAQGADLTLDDVVQLYDVAPAVENPSADVLPR